MSDLWSVTVPGYATGVGTVLLVAVTAAVLWNDRRKDAAEALRDARKVFGIAEKRPVAGLNLGQPLGEVDSLTVVNASPDPIFNVGVGDSTEFDLLVRLRNALGHGNETELRALLANGSVKDTVSWARGRLPVLNRYVAALDKLVWDHLVKATGKEPWR